MSEAYFIKSKQLAVHPNTESIAKKHRNAIYQRPFSDLQRKAFEGADHFVSQRQAKVVLDSGCGTGDSSFWLAEQFPNHTIIAIDQSSVRLQKAQTKLKQKSLPNLFFVRARLEDFWRLVRTSDWEVERHYILYPNPWPKPEHFLRRFHGHPVFSDLLQLAPSLELRTNWRLYLEEFALATKILTGHSFKVQQIDAPEGVSAFERKYRDAQCPCFSLKLSF
jgi:tRNA (guanine-N7-)-methyltransferase